MHRRRRIILALLAVAALLAVPAVHWRLIGWVRGEAFYQGRPTSYWAGEIRSFHCVLITGYGENDLGRPRSFPRRPIVSPLVRRKQRVVDRALTCLGITPNIVNVNSSYWDEEIPFPNADGGAIPVLAQLLKDADNHVRWFAAWRLQDYGPEAAAVIPALWSLVERQEWGTAMLAAAALEQIDPSTLGVLERVWKAEPRSDVMPVRVSGAVKAGGG
jgi:hypothetical protein